MTLSVEHATVGRGGQGQWALGEREPLNPTETFKLEDDALNVRARVEQIYARKGFDSIPDDDLQGRLRWWGLYPAQAGNRRRQDRHPGAARAPGQVLHAPRPHRRWRPVDRAATGHSRDLPRPRPR